MPETDSESQILFFEPDRSKDLDEPFIHEFIVVGAENLLEIPIIQTISYQQHIVVGHRIPDPIEKLVSFEISKGIPEQEDEIILILDRSKDGRYVRKVFEIGDIPLEFDDLIDSCLLDFPHGPFDHVSADIDRAIPQFLLVLEIADEEQCLLPVSAAEVDDIQGTVLDHFRYF